MLMLNTAEPGLVTTENRKECRKDGLKIMKYQKSL